MSVDEKTVRRIAHLARLALDDSEVGKLAVESSKILEWVEVLGQVETEGVAPMAAVIPKPHVLRADTVTDGGHRDALLANAPRAMHGFFAVPKVIE
ncbi:MAG: Asp-tRNA(Asn)/Glu-tRNA(Gln) amidotransferase subunit GatC [Thermaurantiacus sp.]